MPGPPPSGWRPPAASALSRSIDGGFAVFVDFLFRDPDRIAVEVRIGEQPRGRAGVVDDVEPELAVVVADARAAPDDLLEFAHRADDAREHDVLAGRRINAGRQQLRRREDHRRLRFDVLEAAEVAAPDVPFVRRHAADVIGILRHEVGVEIAQRRAHFAGVFLIDAEDDRLGEAVRLLQEVGEVAGDRLGARAQGDDALEVLGLIFVVGDRAPVAVEFVLARPPAGGVPLA